MLALPAAITPETAKETVPITTSTVKAHSKVWEASITRVNVVNN